MTIDDAKRERAEGILGAGLDLALGVSRTHTSPQDAVAILAIAFAAARAGMPVSHEGASMALHNQFYDQFRSMDRKAGE